MHGIRAPRDRGLRCAPSACPPGRPLTPRFPEVTVLLGDPSLPDASKPGGSFHAEDLDCVARLRAALDSLAGYRFTYVDRHEGLLQALVAAPPAFVLNFCDTGWHNRVDLELHVPAVLELLGISYSGASAAAIPLSWDKAMVREVAASLGVAVPEEIFVPAARMAAVLPARYPALVKPSRTDGSLGITQESVVSNEDEARRALDALRRSLPGHDVLLQEFLSGAEYTVGLIGNPGRDLRVLPVLEPDFSDLDPGLPPILGYESKTLPDSPYWTKIRYAEAALDAATRERLVAWSTLLFERFGLRDYGRIDFRTDVAGRVKLLEVNANPAWAYDGKLALMAGVAGLGYPEMLRAILEAAQSRVAP